MKRPSYEMGRMEGPWWWSWLAPFGVGIPNGLDFHGELVRCKRRVGPVFYESNRSYRKRLLRAIREGLPPL